MMFFSLTELNKEIRRMLETYIDLLFQRKESSRRELFQSVERQYLKPLPDTPYHLKDYRRAKVWKMGYVYFSPDKNDYSVPYRYIGKQTQIHYSKSMVEVNFNNVRIAIHERVFSKGIYITKKENIIITDPSGVGKSYLSQAMGHQACLAELKVIYTNTARLFTRLKLAKVVGTYLKEIYKLNKTDLLILDDFGLQAFDNFARETLLDIIDERFNKCSTKVSSQLPVSTWYDIIGEGTIADAILDRLVNSSHRIDLTGQSMRKGILKNE